MEDLEKLLFATCAFVFDKRGFEMSAVAQQVAEEEYVDVELFCEEWVKVTSSADGIVPWDGKVEYQCDYMLGNSGEEKQHIF